MAPRRGRAAVAGALAALLVGGLLWFATRPDRDDGLTSTTTTVPPSGAPERPEPQGSPDHGFSPGHAIFGTPDDVLAADLDGMAATGAGWIRLDLDRSIIEPEPGTYDWSEADRVFDAAIRRGFRVLALPTYTPQWDRPEGSTDKHAPGDPAAFAAFAGAAAERYVPKGVVHWEIWNEANTSSFWQPAPDAAAYAELLRLSSEAIKAVEPETVVLTTGTAPAPDADDGSSVAPTTFLRAVYDAIGAEAFDAVAHHPYSYPLRPTQPDPQNAFAADVPELRRIMDEHGDDDVELWGTEFGAPTGEDERAISPDDQAAYLREGLEAWLSTPGTGPIFVYSWRDTGNDAFDREQNFGVVRTDSMPKPGLDTITRVIEEHCSADPSPCDGGER